tara:strand:- start:8219 stop:9220 length:1002 start_codon:yes stop_codon:yes gene_type:complete
MALETPSNDADFIASVLVEADLRGVDSHGATRLAGYVKMRDNGLLNPLAKIQVLDSNSACTLIDGDNGFGMLGARLGMQTAIEQARKNGIGMSVARNMTHTGLVGYYTMTAAKQGYIGIAMNNGPQIVPAYGGTTPLLATNPISFAFPADKEEPIVLDMATSMVAAGKLRIAEKKGEPIPLDWGLDRNGEPTDDATEVLANGYLQWAGGYKGFGLATAIEVLSGVLSGGTFGTGTPPLKNFGEDPLISCGTYIAIDIEKFIPLNDFQSRVDSLVQMIHSSNLNPSSSRVYASGEIEFERKRERMQNGIPMSDSVYNELLSLGHRFGIESDLLK